MNKAILMGNFVADPEMKTANSGTAIANFRIAVRRAMKNKDGEYESDFLSCVAFGKTAEFVCNHFSKGKKILLTGSIQSRTWEKDGEKRYATEIITENVEFVERKADSNAAPAPAKAKEPVVPAGAVEVANDEDLPF